MVVISGILMLITLTVGGALVLKQQLRQLRAVSEADCNYFDA